MGRPFSPPASLFYPCPLPPLPQALSGLTVQALTTLESYYDLSGEENHSLFKVVCVIFTIDCNSNRESFQLAECIVCVC